ncbi:MAG TPA: plastocyanin/azurin family copper-binding protein [Natronoarchaeum rubrum]|nr:plastocyanin/azurin family copper-binding protein [Natronoarchaeum rubrum]
MNRRDFMKTASGVSAAAAAAGAAGSSAAAQDAPALQEGGNESGGGNQTGGGNESGGGNQSGGGAGTTHEVVVGPGGENVFQPAELPIAPGDTVVWTWDSPNHNIAPQDIPGDAEWEGHPEISDAGTTHEHTFEVTGTYNYVCEPHAAAGMEGSVTVEEGGGGGGGGAAAEFDPHDIGVPMQKHYIGAATFLAIFATIGFTFYLLKYGESANTSYPNKKD